MWARKLVDSFTYLQKPALALLVCSTLAMPSFAQQSKTIGDLLKKIEKKSDKLKVQKKRSSLPKFQRQKAAKVNLRRVKPPSSSSLYFEEGTDEGELERVIDEGIDQLFKLTQRFKRSSKRGELWLRLAEMYVEKARFIEFRIQSKFEEDLEKYDKKKIKRRPRLNLKPAQAYNKKAIQLYEWFLRDFPKDAKVPQALFFLGYNYFELGQVKKGESYYVRLTKNYPKSEYVDESNFALGEYHFENERWKDALKFYSRVANKRGARLRSFALYKTGWCNYKLGNVKKGMKALERVILAGRKSKGVSDRSSSGLSRIRLANESIKDLILFYGESGTYRGARGYFKRVVGSKNLNRILSKLAYYYSDTGNKEAARYVFKDLIKERPNAPKAYDYQYQIVSLYSASGGQSQSFRKELNVWIASYGPGSVWQRVNAERGDLVKKSNSLIESTLRNFVLQQHQNAQNSKSKAAQRVAKDGYELYFDTFKKSPKHDEMHFFFAELLFDMKNYEKSAFHYLWVSDNAPESPYRAKSTLNAILALEKKIPTAKEMQKIVGDSTAPVKFDKTLRVFERISLRYLKEFPKGESALAIKHRLASLYYFYNQFDKAIPIYKEIIAKNPKSQYAPTSARSLLDIYNTQKNFDELERAADSMLEIPSIATSPIGNQIRDIKDKSAFRRAKAIEDGKDFGQSAKAYEDISRKNRGTKIGADAQFNAGVNYERSGDLLKAAAVYAGIVASRNKFAGTHKKKAQKFMADIYEKTGQYKKAAAAFESYAKANPKDRVAREFYYNAAVIYDGMNFYKSATRNYDAYYKVAKSADRPEILFLKAKMELRRGRLRSSVKIFEQYMKSPTQNKAGVIEAAYFIGLIYETLKNKSRAEEWFKKTVRIQRRFAKTNKNIGAAFAAEAKFKLVYKTYRELLALKLKGSTKTITRNFAKKQQIIERLKNELKTVIAYDDAFQIVSALTVNGQAFQHMAAAIVGSPVPKVFKGEQRKQYKAQLAAQAKPFQEEAIKSYKGAIERGFELQAYTPWLKTAMRQLNRIDGKLYPDYGFKVMVTKLPDRVKSKAIEDIPERGDDEDVIPAIAKVLSKNSKDFEALNALAIHHFYKKRYGLAKVVINRALKDHSKEPALHNNLGVTFLAQKDLRAALGAFTKSVRTKRNYKIGAVNLSSIFLEHRHYDASIAPLEDGYDIVKSDLRRGNAVAIEIANNYGVALAGAGKTKQAKRVFDKIIDNDERNISVLLNYAILLVDLMGKKDDAQKVLSRLKFIADDPKIRKKVTELQSKVDG